MDPANTEAQEGVCTSTEKRSLSVQGNGDAANDTARRVRCLSAQGKQRCGITLLLPSAVVEAPVFVGAVSEAELAYMSGEFVFWERR